MVGENKDSKKKKTPIKKIIRISCVKRKKSIDSMN